MSVTIPSKVQENVRDRRCKNADLKIVLEDRNEEYIKRELKIK